MAISNNLGKLSGLMQWLCWPLIALTAGCSSPFFYPDRHFYSDPAELNPNYQSLYLPTQDGGRIHAWWLPAQTAQDKGTLLFFHGNAQNLTSHVINLAWINKAGYNLMVFDYRGYGQSVGDPNLANALMDARAAYDWVLEQNGPLFVIGQSLGGVLATAFIAENPEVKNQIKGLIIDAAFTGFQDIAREKLGAFWLTWPLQYPLSWLVVAAPDPVDALPKMSDLPKLLIHSTRDVVIPFAHGDKLFAVAAPPKQRLVTDTEHTYTFTAQKYRGVLLSFLNQDNDTVVSQ